MQWQQNGPSHFASEKREGSNEKDKTSVGCVWTTATQDAKTVCRVKMQQDDGEKRH